MECASVYSKTNIHFSAIISLTRKTRLRYTVCIKHELYA